MLIDSARVITIALRSCSSQDQPPARFVSTPFQYTCVQNLEFNGSPVHLLRRLAGWNGAFHGDHQSEDFRAFLARSGNEQKKLRKMGPKKYRNVELKRLASKDVVKKAEKRIKSRHQ